MHNLFEKAKPIRLAIFDVDGIFTNGTLFYGAQGMNYKEFNVLDGQGIKLLQNSGVIVAIITSKTSDIVTRRMTDLGIKFIYQGQEDKLNAYESLKNHLQLKDNEIAYAGDDLPDLPILRRVGLSLSVPNAHRLVQENVLGITKAHGGSGAVREICELIMLAQGTYDQVIQPFLK